jgi:hypothetical protein
MERGTFHGTVLLFVEKVAEVTEVAEVAEGKVAAHRLYSAAIIYWG